MSKQPIYIGIFQGTKQNFCGTGSHRYGMGMVLLLISQTPVDNGRRSIALCCGKYHSAEEHSIFPFLTHLVFFVIFPKIAYGCENDP